MSKLMSMIRYVIKYISEVNSKRKLEIQKVLYISVREKLKEFFWNIIKRVEKFQLIDTINDVPTLN